MCKRGICRDTSHGLVVSKNHKFYYQVQQLMLCTKSSWADLVLSDTVDLIILHVHISLEIAYPRVLHGLTRLSLLIND